MPLSDDDRATLSAYLDGELDEAAVHQVESRLSLDSEARAEYETLRQTWSLLDYLPRATPAADFTNRTLERLSLERSTSPGARIAHRVPTTLVWAAAVLLAAGLGYALGGQLPSSAPESTPDNVADSDEALVRHLRVIELWPLYQNAEDLDFLRQIDQPELFGEESGSPP
jgi:anti-sigma factor RsiW